MTCVVKRCAVFTALFASVVFAQNFQPPDFESWIEFARKIRETPRPAGIRTGSGFDADYVARIHGKVPGVTSGPKTGHAFMDAVHDTEQMLGLDRPFNEAYTTDDPYFAYRTASSGFDNASKKSKLAAPQFVSATSALEWITMLCDAFVKDQRALDALYQQIHVKAESLATAQAKSEIAILWTNLRQDRGNRTWWQVVTQARKKILLSTYDPDEVRVKTDVEPRDDYDVRVHLGYWHNPSVEYAAFLRLRKIVNTTPGEAEIDTFALQSQIFDSYTRIRIAYANLYDFDYRLSKLNQLVKSAASRGFTAPKSKPSSIDEIEKRLKETDRRLDELEERLRKRDVKGDKE